MYPYLLRGLSITRSNHVWALDITYIPMARGFVYLVAVMDWFSRKVLAWRLSITMDTEFCVAAMQEAIARYGIPEIFNTDQGSQFTSNEFTGLLKAHGIRISMDGHGCWLDNVFIERLWRAMKYEEVYLKAYESVSVARERFGRYLEFYNTRRPHSSLDQAERPTSSTSNRCRCDRGSVTRSESTYRSTVQLFRRTGPALSWRLPVADRSGRRSSSISTNGCIQTPIVRIRA